MLVSVTTYKWMSVMKKRHGGRVGRKYVIIFTTVVKLDGESDYECMGNSDLCLCKQNTLKC